MKILITAATDFELIGVQQKIKSTKNREIIFAITGVGMLATAVSLMKLIFEQQPDFIIQIGIAGCFDVQEKLGSVYLVEEEFLGDVGVLEDNKWKDVFDLGLVKQNSKPFKKKGIINTKIKQYNFIDLPTVKAVTVNLITTDKNLISQLLKKYNPIIETMEGAALHYVCNLNNVPYLQIRATSNYVGERDKTKWKMKLAMDNLSRTLKSLINHQSSIFNQ